MERRKSVRIDAHNFIRFELFDNNGNIIAQDKGEIKNISIGGVCFSTDYELPLNSEIEFEINLEKLEMKGKGEVKRVDRADNEYTTSLQFSIEDPMTLETILNLVYL